jgi:hypothetical protein
MPVLNNLTQLAMLLFEQIQYANGLGIIRALCRCCELGSRQVMLLARCDWICSFSLYGRVTRVGMRLFHCQRWGCN